MTPERFEELLGALLDDALSPSEAGELARELGRSPERLRAVRAHLAMWELWSQTQVPERSAEAFVAAWRTRWQAENENPDEFPGALRTRLEGERPVPRAEGRRPFWRRPLTVLGTLGLAAAGVGVLWLAIPGTSLAGTRLQGETVCTHCGLQEPGPHAPALLVQESGRVRIVYLDRSPVLAGQQGRFCGGPVRAIVEGRLHREGKRDHLVPASIQFAAASP
jgi:hypothetical protein